MVTTYKEHTSTKCGSSVAPIRLLINLGSGVADLILLPIEQYKEDSSRYYPSDDDDAFLMDEDDNNN